MMRVVSYRVRKCGRSMNRQIRDRGTGMRLTERTRKLIPKGAIIRNEDDVDGRAGDEDNER